MTEYYIITNILFAVSLLAVILFTWFGLMVAVMCKLGYWELKKKDRSVINNG